MTATSPLIRLNARVPSMYNQKYNVRSLDTPSTSQYEYLDSSPESEVGKPVSHIPYPKTNLISINQFRDYKSEIKKKEIDRMLDIEIDRSEIIFPNHIPDPKETESKPTNLNNLLPQKQIDSDLLQYHEQYLQQQQQQSQLQQQQQQYMQQQQLPSPPPQQQQYINQIPNIPPPFSQQQQQQQQYPINYQSLPSPPILLPQQQSSLPISLQSDLYSSNYINDNNTSLYSIPPPVTITPIPLSKLEYSLPSMKNNEDYYIALNAQKNMINFSPEFPSSYNNDNNTVMYSYNDPSLLMDNNQNYGNLYNTLSKLQHKNKRISNISTINNNNNNNNNNSGTNSSGFADESSSSSSSSGLSNNKINPLSTTSNNNKPPKIPNSNKKVKSKSKSILININTDSNNNSDNNNTHTNSSSDSNDLQPKTPIPRNNIPQPYKVIKRLAKKHFIIVETDKEYSDKLADCLSMFGIIVHQVGQFSDIPVISSCYFISGIFYSCEEGSYYNDYINIVSQFEEEIKIPVYCYMKNKEVPEIVKHSLRLNGIDRFLCANWTEDDVIKLIGF